MCSALSIYLSFLMCLLAAPAPNRLTLPARSWTDADGASWTAHLIGIEKKEVIFRAADSGEEFRRSLDRLSTEDREFAGK